MKKKLILIALTVVLTLGIALVITGCGGSDSGGSSDGTTLTLWTHNNEESWNASYQSIVDAYMEEHPDGVTYINVRIVENPTWRSL